MSMNQTDSASHREVQNLLPWYVNGTLSPDKRESVAAHLAACPDCLSEAGMLQAVSAAVKESDENLPFPAEDGLNVLLSRIEREEGARRGRGPVARLRQWWAPLPTFAKWALAGQAVAVVALACMAVALWRRANHLEAAALQQRPRIGVPEATPSPAGQGPQYKPLSEQEGEAAGPVVKFTVGFREDATEKEIRELLTAIKANIVSGPSPVRFYVISIVVPPESDARKVSDEALERLRQRQDVVRLAEPRP